MITFPAELVSMPAAMQALQITPARVRSLAADLGIAPFTIIDGCEHFTAADLERIRQHLAGPALPPLDPFTALQLDQLD